MIHLGLIDEQIKRYGDLITPQKISSLASRVHWLNRKGKVKNESAMFVSIVRDAVIEAIVAWERKHSPDERERHALFMVEMLRSARQEPPCDVARCIRAARSNGFPNLDEYLMDKLEVMGESWDRSD